jgi:hypothetical protein
METAIQLFHAPIDSEHWQRFAWDIAAICISLTASLILLGIWRRGYPEIAIEDDKKQKKTLRDDGVMWMFRACALWCATYIVDVAGLIGLFHLPEDSPVLAFVRVAFSLTNSVFFVLATANMNAVKDDDSSRLAALLGRTQSRAWYMAGVLILIAAMLFGLTERRAMACQLFDAVINVITILLMAWGFFKSFRERRFPIIAGLSLIVFSIFLFTEVGLFVNAISRTSLLARNRPFGTALAVASDGMVSLLFIALTFSWVHEKIDKLTSTDTEPIDDISQPPVVAVARAK